MVGRKTPSWGPWVAGPQDWAILQSQELGGTPSDLDLDALAPGI